MCGIAGFAIAPGDRGRLDIAGLTRALLLGIEHRGKDATGVAFVSPSGRVRLAKRPEAASKFLGKRRGIGANAIVGLLHTRAATQGSPANPANNHPIAVGDVIGIHNGVLWNDGDIFDTLGTPRIAEVDSEAIFAALHHYDDAGAALELVDGSYATAWVDVTDPTVLHVARGYASPVVYLATKNGSVIFASTVSALKEGAFGAGMSCPGKFDDYVRHLGEGERFCIDAAQDVGVIELPGFDAYGTNAPGAMKGRGMYGRVGQRDWADFTGWDQGPVADPPPRTDLFGNVGDSRLSATIDARSLAQGDVVSIPIGGETIIGEVTGVGMEFVMIDFGEQMLDLSRIPFHLVQGV